MLRKLRSRHPIDLPAEGFQRSTGLIVVIGGLALLAVILPLVAAIAQGALTWITGIVIGFAVLVIVFLAMGALGVKPGYRAVGRGGNR